MAKDSFSLGLIFAILIFVLALVRKEELRWVFMDTSFLAETEGKIISSSIQYKGGASKNASGWHYEIHYEYFVEGERHESSLINLSYTGSSDSSFAETYVEKYEPGKQVAVYYDPSNPEFAILEPEVKWPSLFYFIIGVSLVSIILWGISGRLYYLSRTIDNIATPDT